MQETTTYSCEYHGWRRGYNPYCEIRMPYKKCKGQGIECNTDQSFEYI